MSDEQKKPADQALRLFRAAADFGALPTANLLAKGFDVNLQDAENNSALMVAASFRRAQTLLLLLSKGANVSLKNQNGKTALHAVFDLNASPDCMGILIDGLADINAQDNDGNTPFHVGLSQCAINDPETEKALMLLLEAGSNLLIPNNKNETAAFLLTKKTSKSKNKYPPSLVRWGQMILDRKALEGVFPDPADQSPSAPRQSKL